MRLIRLESNVLTGEVRAIAQKAYRNTMNDSIVLDASESPPAGYVEYDPYKEEAELTE